MKKKTLSPLNSIYMFFFFGVVHVPYGGAQLPSYTHFNNNLQVSFEKEQNKRVRLGSPGLQKG